MNRRLILLAVLAACFAAPASAQWADPADLRTAGAETDAAVFAVEVAPPAESPAVEDAAVREADDGRPPVPEPPVVPRVPAPCNPLAGVCRPLVPEPPAATVRPATVPEPPTGGVRVAVPCSAWRPDHCG